jgi:hypothetical protein
MNGLIFGKCRRCDAPISYFSRTCPNCSASNQPNPVSVLTGLAVLAVLIAGAITFGLQAFRNPAAPSQAPGDRTASVSEQGKGGEDDYGWVVQAMADCDVAAKQTLDKMHFLIVPVITTGMTLPGWNPRPISTIGKSASLLSSSDAMIGLRNRMLALYQKPLTFAISDPASQTVYKWKPSVGVTSLTTPDTGLTSLTLGFEIPDVAKEIEWGPTINLSKGTCYWINPIIRTAVSSG